MWVRVKEKVRESEKRWGESWRVKPFQLTFERRKVRLLSTKLKTFGRRACDGFLLGKPETWVIFGSSLGLTVANSPVEGHQWMVRHTKPTCIFRRPRSQFLLLRNFYKCSFRIFGAASGLTNFHFKSYRILLQNNFMLYVVDAVVPHSPYGE